MKRFTILFLALILSLCAVQMSTAQIRPIEEEPVCYDCEPPPPPCSNPIDEPMFFVRQQYRDFLFREPTGGELASDVAPLHSCLHYGDLACYNTERVKMSRRMWDKPEFRQQSRTFGLPLTNGWELYNHEDFILLEYSIYLQRWADTPGYNFWLGNLDNCVANSGGNPTYVSQCYNDSINAFLQSTEYR
ncbi:MAG: DUF4214 domain-containing protein, partial [Acidobacteriota bacterium]|nr:DUF4214 domain-containing protein [Acidobacteriota bacterium]